MFTGIIEEIGIVKSISKDSLSIQANIVLEGTKIGDSIAVNGVCLTVISVDKSGFSVEIMPETIKLTNIGILRISDRVNLERAMPATGRFGGHFVEGHIDTTGKLISLISECDAVIASIKALPNVLKYIVYKGFIAVNGVSLTVTDCDPEKFSVSLVTFTRENTNLGTIKQGNTVNLEVDIMAKYIERFYHPDKQEGIIKLLEKYNY